MHTYTKLKVIIFFFKPGETVCTCKHSSGEAETGEPLGLCQSNLLGKPRPARDPGVLLKVASEMTQRKDGCVSRHKSLHSIPGSHKVAGENQPPRVVLFLPSTLAPWCGPQSTLVCACAHTQFGASSMNLWVKCLLCKSNNLSSICRTHRVEGEN